MVDTHSHLNFPEFKEDLLEVIQRAKENSVDRFLVVGTDIRTSERAILLAEGRDEIFATVGFHPSEAEGFNRETADRLKKLAKRKKVVALGEIGLDYYRKEPSPERQKFALRQLLEINKELNLPLIIHNRLAKEDILTILKEGGHKKGVFHCFSEDIPFVRKVLDLGFYISFTGNLTYRKNEELRKSASFVPLNRLLLETDCPFLPPEGKRGKRNEPSFLIYLAKELARIKNLSLEEIDQRTTENAFSLFSNIRP